MPNLDYVLSMMVRGIDEVALEAGYTVMVCQSNESFGREIVNTKRLSESLVDGFIVSVSSETKIFDHFKKIQERELPMVVFDRVTPHLKAPSVLSYFLVFMTTLLVSCGGGGGGSGPAIPGSDTPVVAGIVKTEVKPITSADLSVDSGMVAVLWKATQRIKTTQYFIVLYS